MDEIRKWLNGGSINILGAPFSGKDTVGKRLAKDLSAEFVSSGDLLRQAGDKDQAIGLLSPSEVFYDVILPIFDEPRFANKPLILSSIGRWIGEEQKVMQSAADGRHPIKFALYLKVSQEEISRRLAMAKTINDRAVRADDKAEFRQQRLAEFNNKTLPVIERYRAKNLLLEIDGEGTRDEVYGRVVDGILQYIKTKI
jgi:adenylate kinase